MSKTTHHRLRGSWYVDGYASTQHADFCPAVAIDGVLYHTDAADLDDLEPDKSKPVQPDAEGFVYPAAVSSVAFAPKAGEIDRALAKHHAKAAA